MSSPFADKFLGKSPMSPASKELVGGQNRLSPEHQAAIKASPAEMHHGSPAEKHEPIDKELKKLNKKYGDTDFYERKDVQELIKKKTKAKEAHKSDSKVLPIDDKNSYEYDYDQNEDITTAPKDSKKKTSGLNYGSPLDASYSNPNDYHYVSNAADFQRLQDNIVAGTKAAMSPKIIDNYQEKRADRRDKRAPKKGAPGTDKREKFDKKTQFIRDKSDKHKNQSKCTPGSVTVNKDGSTTTCP